MSGSGTATLVRGRKSAEIHRNCSAAQKFSIDDPGQAAVT